MTPDAPKPSPNAPESPAKWVSVSEAAAARRCSIRTVKRWIETGEVESRKEGGRRLVLLLDSGADGRDKRDTPKMPKGTHQKGHNPGGVSLHVQKEGQKGHSEETEDARPVSPLALSGGESNDRETLLLDSLASERAQVAFLRATIEQLQRDGAETRAALREALKAMPKAITTGSESSGAAATTGPKPTERAPNAPESSKTGLSYGDIADWLEENTNDANNAK